MPKKVLHLYRNGAVKRQAKEFEKRYGKVKGQKIYGAVVGKVKRQREDKKIPTF